MSEADIHFDFYRYLENAIEKKPQRGAITYGTARAEYSKDIDGRADIVVFDEYQEPVFVIEAKRPGGGRKIDPFAPAVIRQAFRYAGDLGAPYFCTYNRGRLVIFDAFEEGVPLLQRKTKSYEVENPEAFASTLLDEISRLQAGTEVWDSLDDVFIDRIRSLHEFVSPELEASIADQLTDSTHFEQNFLEWTQDQGVDYTEASEGTRLATREQFSEQAAYLTINKILFYKILEQSPVYADDIRPLAVSPFRVREDLNEYFEAVVRDVDFEAVYEHDNVYSEIPLDSVSERLRNFIIELDEQDLTQFDSDVIGRIYEKVIPKDRRRQYGEYYTPPPVCDLITRLTIDSAGDRVLDPACGSGGFLIAAYQRIKSLLDEPAGSHERILSQIYGVEINRFPAHLSAINLAIQDLDSYTHDVNIRIRDFFDLKEYTQFGDERASAQGSEETPQYSHEQFGEFDALIANPPYIRQENIDDKGKVRHHLTNQGVNAEYISKRSDIYTYFITHATEFLNDSGRLGFITSDRWLDTAYGADLQQFILENYSIETVIKFERQAFEDALIGSTVLILERVSDPDVRNSNVAKFIMVREGMEIGEVIELVKDDHEPELLKRTPEYRMVTKSQMELGAVDKWTRFFIAPSLYFELESSENTTRLGGVAELEYGIKSGANQFFIGRREDMVDLGLEEYIRPLLKASGQVRQISFEGIQAQEWAILDIHDLVQEAREESDSIMDDDPARRVKEWLREDHEVLANYIDWGEEEGFDTNSTCQQRPIWFDLGEMNPAPLLIPRFAWRENVVLLNKEQGVGTTQFYDIYPDSGINPKLLCAVLNSRLAWLSREIEGRQAGGQGMTRSEIKVYEAKEILIPKLDTLDDNDKDSIIKAFDNLLSAEASMAEGGRDDSSLIEERDALDKVILSAIGFENRFQELKEAVDALVSLREREAGEETEVLIDRVEEGSEVISLEGVSSVSSRSQLSDFS